MDRKETEPLYRSGDSLSERTFIPGTGSTGCGLYKVVEAIGTMIQNIKYISIYINTARFFLQGAGLVRNLNICFEWRVRREAGEWGDTSTVTCSLTHIHTHTHTCTTHMNPAWTHRRLQNHLMLARKQAWDLLP